MKTAFTFPGQGSQAVGMGREIAEAYPQARAVFEEVDEALGEPLSTVIFDGPIEDLTLTTNTQPALMAVSLAVMRVLEARGFDLGARVAFVAGHSLGEYAALAAAGSLSIGDTARLLRTRGQAMQAAVPVGEGAMAAIIGLELDDVAAIAREAAGDQICQPANDNGGGQVVVSGNRAAVQRAVDLAPERGARRAIMLQVSAPFHCALMQPAADVMAEALAGVDVHAPRVPLVANVTAAPTTDPDLIRSQLVEQVTSMVRWRETVGWLAAERVELFVEVGAGKVLSGLARRIASDGTSLPVSKPDDIDRLLEAME
ncbi:MAG: ACP S-malonyltransferase [Alphaproteobacteria bacterium]